MLMSSAVAAMVLASAVAQAGPTTTRQEVKVPFPFVVNGHEMPAGTYSVREDEEQGSALLIQGEGASIFVLTSPVNSASAPQDTSLVFTKDGDRYRLAEVWDDAGDGVAIVNAR
jgi:hypothetical protein